MTELLSLKTMRYIMCIYRHKRFYNISQGDLV